MPTYSARIQLSEAKGKALSGDEYNDLHDAMGEIGFTRAAPSALLGSNPKNAVMIPDGDYMSTDRPEDADSIASLIYTAVENILKPNQTWGGTLMTVGVVRKLP